MINWSRIRTLSVIYAFITALLAFVVISFIRVGVAFFGDIPSAEEALVAVIFVGTMLWVIGGIYSLDDILWPRQALIEVFIAEYVNARTHLIARLLQALGGSVGAYTAAAYYGLDTQKDHPGNLIGMEFIVFGLVTIALTIVILPVIWLVKSKALDLSLELLRTVLESSVYATDNSQGAPQSNAGQFDATYAQALLNAKTKGTRLERLAVNEIEDALRQRAALIARVPTIAKADAASPQTNASQHPG